MTPPAAVARSRLPVFTEAERVMTIMFAENTSCKNAFGTENRRPYARLSKTSAANVLSSADVFSPANGSAHNRNCGIINLSLR